MSPEPRPPKFQWGQSVVAALDLYNDGSLPDTPEDALVVVAGGPGEIVNIGHHESVGCPVYMVDFGVAVIGCLEEELAVDGAADRAADPIA